MALNPQAVALAAKINKEYGEGSVVVGSTMKEPPRFTSGSPTLDLALGGGWPANRWVEVYGQESNGKTAIVLKTLAANQALDPDFSALWVASEPYDYEQAAALGVDNDRVVVCETQDMPYAFEVMLQYTRSQAVDAIILDSYPALIAPEEEEKGMDEAVMAVGARQFGKFFRKAGSASKRADGDRPFLGIIINQQRDKIGARSPIPGHIPQTTPGGNAKNYAFYTRVLVKRDEYIEEGIPGKNLKVKVGQRIKVTTVKNKSASPQQVASIDFYFRDCPNREPHKHGKDEVLPFNRGEYDVVKELVILGILYDLIVRKGRYFEFGERRWGSRDEMFQVLYEQVDVRDALENEVHQIALHKPITEDDFDKAATAGTRTVSRAS